MLAKDHPIWSLLRMAIIAGVGGFALWFNYSSTDIRDVWTLLYLLAASGGIELWQHRKDIAG